MNKMLMSRIEAIEYVVYTLKNGCVPHPQEVTTDVQFEKDVTRVLQLYNRIQGSFITDLQQLLIHRAKIEFIYKGKTVRECYKLCIKLINQLSFSTPDISSQCREDRDREITTCLNLIGNFVSKYDYYINKHYTSCTQRHKSHIGSIKELSDGKIVTSSNDKTLKISDIYTLEGHTDTIIEIAILKDDRIISSSHDSTLRIWEDGKESILIRYDNEYVKCIAFLPGDLIVTGSSSLSGLLDDRLVIRDLNTEIYSCNYKRITVIIVVPFTVDKYRIIIACNDGLLKVLNPDTLEVERTLQQALLIDIHIVLALSKDRIVSAAYNGCVRIWNWKMGELLFNLEYESEEDFVIEMITHQEWIITGSKHGVLKMWNSDTGELKSQFTFPDWISALDILPNNNIIVCLGDGQINILDLEKQSITELCNRSICVSSLLVTKKGKVLIGYEDGMIQIID